MGAWVARNTGLTGGALTVRWIVQNPATRHLPSTSHDLWIATNKGIYRSFNGGRQWDQIALPDPSNNEYILPTQFVVEILDFYWIDYDPTNELTLYAIAAIEDETDGRLWMYKTVDLGVTWTSRGLIVTNFFDFLLG